MVGVSTACSGDGPSGPVPGGEVRVSNNQFTLANLTVTLGSTATFRWASGNRSSGSFDRLFDATGAYAYEGRIHAGMSGTITVSPPL